VSVPPPDRRRDPPDPVFRHREAPSARKVARFSHQRPPTAGDGDTTQSGIIACYASISQHPGLALVHNAHLRISCKTHTSSRRCKNSPTPRSDCPSCKDALSSCLGGGLPAEKRVRDRLQELQADEKPSCWRRRASRRTSASASKAEAKGETKTASAPAASASGPTPAAGTSSGQAAARRCPVRRIHAPRLAPLPDRRHAGVCRWASRCGFCISCHYARPDAAAARGHPSRVAVRSASRALA
jgi:hypothetical protein